ncbi:helix-turn-helix domain-containing protein [Paraliobacillus sediminis]|uniref:helix-turn-helix domain-containing protein n=1 Tax=Paraliobacillus sediminis TaxID=1885916 RepID=UPI000E3D31B9|nr:helix-turn-helix transcriptional regulator [Paraliobacillus sediminis]
MIIVKPKNPTEIRILIAEGGNSLRTFAEEIGISHPYVSQILNFKRNPSPVAAAKIAEGLGLKLGDIFLIESVANDNLVKEI